MKSYRKIISALLFILVFGTIYLVKQANKVEPFTFVQICDTQLGATDYQKDSASFQQAVKQINRLNPDLVLICGDLVQTPNQQSFNDFNAIKSKLNMPCYCIAGNHDVLNEPTDSSLTFYRDQIGDDYYSFSHKGVSFVIINTQLWKFPIERESVQQDQWFSETISEIGKQDKPVIVAGHYPLFLNASDEDDEYFNLPKDKRMELLELFNTHNVKAYLSGHVHKLIMNQYHNIQLVSGEATSHNVDKSPKGFRLWKISKDDLSNEFIPLEER